MTVSEELELQALRKRVYGPDADLAPEAIRRLQELEDARRAPVLGSAVESDVTELFQEPVLVVVPQPEPPRRGEIVAEWLLLRLKRLERLRRSTVLIALGVVVALTVIAVALTVAHRLQTGPLQVGAEEVARLSVDPTYEAPRIFTNGVDGVTVQAFESFHGLRPIVTIGALFSNSAEECLNVIAEVDVSGAQSDTFSGQLMNGCAAGGFPAMTQFAASLDGFPQELAEAFPDSGLQFVHDSVTREVVVFASPLDS